MHPIHKALIHRGSLTLVALATVLLMGQPAAMATDNGYLVDKTIDCSTAADKRNCVECGADRGIYCCVAGLHNCTVKNPPPPAAAGPHEMDGVPNNPARAGLRHLFHAVIPRGSPAATPD